MSAQLVPFSFGGVIIHRDADGRVSLTDLHRAASGTKAQVPAKWQETAPAQSFLRAVCRILNIPRADIIKTTRGKGGGSYGHQQVALEYAQYLSPDLAVAVNQVFFERVEEEKSPDLILNRAVATYERRGFTRAQINARLLGKTTRNQLTSALARHGVRGEGFRLCTNATYEPLWGGNAAHVRQRKNLPVTANPRDHMSEAELVGLHLAELLARESIETRQLRGNQACAAECRRAAQNVARAITSHHTSPRK